MSHVKKVKSKIPKNIICYRRRGIKTRPAGATSYKNGELLPGVEDAESRPDRRGQPPTRTGSHCLGSKTRNQDLTAQSPKQVHGPEPLYWSEDEKYLLIIPRNGLKIETFGAFQLRKLVPNMCVEIYRKIDMIIINGNCILCEVLFEVSLNKIICRAFFCLLDFFLEVFFLILIPG